jgi:hypothetical protein
MHHQQALIRGWLRAFSASAVNLIMKTVQTFRFYKATAFIKA